ncbi:MAG: hypothetical protein ABII82_14415, partial [Verrucomicrobiota bacterium]
MTHKNSFTIAGRRVIHPLGAPSWSLREGARPHAEDFEIPAGNAAEFAPDGEPQVVTVRLEDVSGEEPIDHEGLFVVQVGPSAVPHIELMTVVDQRYFWSSKHLFRRFNMRRTIGHRRISSPSALEMRDVTDDVWYWAASLRGYVPGDSASGRPWTIGEIAEELARETHRFVKTDLWPYCPDPIIDHPDVLGRVIPQNFELDDDLATCWMRLLAYMPSIKLSIAATGAIVVETRVRMEAEAAAQHDELMRNELGPEVWGSGHVEVVARGNERPRAFIVLVTPEHEVRFDYEEPTSLTDSYVEPAASDRQLVNVVAVTDYTLGDYVQGDYISFAEAMGLWNADLPADSTFAFDWQVLRALILPYLDLASALRQEGGNIIRSDWAGRIDAMQQHFRRTYRLPRAWLDACMDILDVRVAVANPETGDRAGAAVYSDWFRVYGRRNHLFQFRFGSDNLSLGSNVRGYPTDGLLTNETVQAPARVALFNKDLGL